MAKIILPKFRYLCQDPNGSISIGIEKPYIDKEDEGFGWIYRSRGYIYDYERGGEPSPNWQNTLIDLETDDYDYTDGILTRIEK